MYKRGGGGGQRAKYDPKVVPRVGVPPSIKRRCDNPRISDSQDVTVLPDYSGQLVLLN